MLSDIIDEFQNEHQKLSQELEQIKEEGLVSEEARKRLFAAKDLLMQHLKKEDEKLYPALRKAAEEDEELKHTLDTSAKELEKITQQVSDFLQKYESGEGGTEFARDMGEIIAVLKNRIRKEEMVLFKEYRKLEEQGKV